MNLFGAKTQVKPIEACGFYISSSVLTYILFAAKKKKNSMLDFGDAASDSAGGVIYSIAYVLYCSPKK